MSEWKRFNVNRCMIRYETEAAYLVAMPKKGNYKGRGFWVGKSLCRRGQAKSLIEVGYHSDFDFELIKLKDREADAIVVDGDTLAEEFDYVDQYIPSEAPSRYETHVPDKVDAAAETDVPWELRDE